MDSHRRHVLGVLGSGLGVGLAGCLSRAEADGSGRPGSVADAGSQQAVASDVAGGDGDSDLARTTDRIMDELAWFATEYTDAIRAYRAAGEDVLEVVREVGATVPLTPADVDRLDGEFDRPAIDQGWPYDYDTAVSWDEDERLWRYIDVDWPDPDPDAAGEPPLTDEDLERLREVTHAFAETFEAELEPHFHGAKKERAFADEAIEVLERFTEYEDTAMVVAGLLRLYHHYDTLTGAEYVEEHLSSDPIQNRLIEFLTPAGVDTSLPVLYEVAYDGQTSQSHSAFAYGRDIDDSLPRDLKAADPMSSIDGATPDPSPITLSEAVSPLEARDSLVDSAFLLSNLWTPFDRSDRYYPAELEAQGIVVHRYEDEGAAETAFDRISTDLGTYLGDVSFGSGSTNRWNRIRYGFNGEPWYTAGRRTGRHVLIVAPAKRPFEHRQADINRRPSLFDDGTAEWKAPLAVSWIWSVADGLPFSL